MDFHNLSLKRRLGVFLGAFAIASLGGVLGLLADGNDSGVLRGIAILLWLVGFAAGLGVLLLSWMKGFRLLRSPRRGSDKG